MVDVTNLASPHSAERSYLGEFYDREIRVLFIKERKDRRGEWFETGITDMRVREANAELRYEGAI